jgi:hypothetical protein
MYIRFHFLTLFVLLFAITGCKRLPEAPESLEEITNYLFEHFDDEDPLALESGLVNLDLWLADNMEQANVGYKVDDLSSAAVDSLEGTNLTLDEQVGVAVAYDIGHEAVDVINTLVMVGSDELYPDNFENFRRDFVTEPECFVDHSCEQTTWEASSQTSYPLNIKVSTAGRTEYRWVEMEDGYAAVTRNWMIAPADVSVDWFELEQQYALSALINRNGTTRKLDAGWVIVRLSALPLPENTVINMAASGLLETGEALEYYLDNTGPYFN